MSVEVSRHARSRPDLGSDAARCGLRREQHNIDSDRAERIGHQVGTGHNQNPGAGDRVGEHDAGGPHDPRRVPTPDGSPAAHHVG
mgnify:CR=1 FL=1